MLCGNNIKYILFTAFIAICSATVFAEDRIGKIFIDIEPVFVPTDKDWFFAAPLFNSLHSTTKKYIVKDELLFSTGDIISEDLFLETERNLRATGLFTTVKIELDKVGENEYNAYVHTKDRWSLYPAVLFAVSAEDMRYGARFQEYNLFGTGTHVSAEALYREELGIGWQGTFFVENRRLFRSNLALLCSLKTQQYQTIQLLSLQKQFYTQETKSAYGILGSKDFGNEFLLNKTALYQHYPNDTAIQHYIDTAKFIPINEVKADAWYAQMWKWKDKVYLSGWTEYYSVDRGDSIFDRAYDNQGKFLIGFSSVAQNFYTVKGVNSYHDEDLVIGGWGTAILGKTFPIANYGGGEGLFYVAAQAEKSYYNKDLYLFGQLTAASSFTHGYAKYTYQEFLALLFYKLTDKLVLAARFHEQAVWNWPELRQLSLDDKYGLRGYTIGSLAGENRLLSNTELRFFPDWQVFVLKISGLAFCDIATVWNQTEKIAKSRFYSSLGVGLRLHFTKSDNPNHTWRIDVPYNTYTGRFALSLGVSQYFSAFSNHDYRLPEIYGTEFDDE